jgi:uncharacterized protein (DUF58 family)
VSSTLGPAPRPLLVHLLFALALMALAAAWWPPLGVVWAALTGLLLVLVAIDAALLYRRPVPTVQRSLPSAMSIGEWHEQTLRVENTAGSGVRLMLADVLPEGLEAREPRVELALAAGEQRRYSLGLRASKRGVMDLQYVDLKLVGWLTLLDRTLRASAPGEARVYPNFHAVAAYALMSAERRQAQLGVHQQRRRGEGLEFFQLRDYREGDSLRQVDWKAASRRNQLISREYREEQNQQIIFLLDCGRRMHSRDGALTHFDHVLNAVLLLTWSALRQGDAVGVQTFSGPERWLPPRRGGSAMNDVLNTVFDLQTTDAPSDYAEAVTRLAQRQRRRALVVLITNLRDDDAADVPVALAALRRTHLVLVASLREPALDVALDAPLVDLQGALRLAGLHHYLDDRQRAHQSLRARGVQTLDVTPAGLPAALVNKYLDIKRAGLL